MNHNSYVLSGQPTTRWGTLLPDVLRVIDLLPRTARSSATAVMRCLGKYAKKFGLTNVWPSQETIARTCRLSTRTVRRIVKALERLGLIAIRKLAPNRTTCPPTSTPRVSGFPGERTGTNTPSVSDVDWRKTVGGSCGMSHKVTHRHAVGHQETSHVSQRPPEFDPAVRETISVAERISGRGLRDADQIVRLFIARAGEPPLVTSSGPVRYPDAILLAARAVEEEAAAGIFVWRDCRSFVRYIDSVLWRVRTYGGEIGQANWRDIKRSQRVARARVASQKTIGVPCSLDTPSQPVTIPDRMRKFVEAMAKRDAAEEFKRWNS